MTPAEPEQPADPASRLEPFFKSITILNSERVGLTNEPTERTYTPRADLILSVPPAVSVENTLFDFFARVNVIEFKSQNDKFNLREYVRNELRTGLRFLDEPEADLEDFLNVIITARLPSAFLAYAASRKVIFQAQSGRPWLYLAQVGLQNVAIVVCRLLPLEPRFYPWLAFAPSASVSWRNYILQLIEENNQQYLGLAREVYPEEVKMLTDEEFDKRLHDILNDPANQNIGLKRDPALNAVVALEEVDQDAPEQLGEVLSILKPEQRLAGLKPEERLSGLKPEERLSGLKPEERLSGLKPEERLSGLTTEEKAALLELLQRQSGSDQN